MEHSFSDLQKYGDHSLLLCPICHAKSKSVRYRLGYHSILRCRSCTFMWLSPQPCKESLKNVYDSEYFQNSSFFESGNGNLFGYFDYVAERFNKQKNFKTQIDEVISFMKGFQPGRSRLLDVGCGLGFLLDVAHDAGFKVTGLEYNESAVKTAREKYTFPIHTGDILGFEDDPFDVITIYDVIEHLFDPIAAIGKINSLLKDNGLLILTTMDCDSIVSRILGTRLEDFRRVREHLFFFNRSSLRRMLKQKGFEVLSIKFSGHTFQLTFLADRLRLISPLLGKFASNFVKYFNLSGIQLHINPLTKIQVIARKLPG